MGVTLLQQCRVHKNRVQLSAWITLHIVFDKKKGERPPESDRLQRTMLDYRLADGANHRLNRLCLWCRWRGCR